MINSLEDEHVKAKQRGFEGGERVHQVERGTKGDHISTSAATCA